MSLCHQNQVWPPWQNKVTKRSQNTAHKVPYGLDVQSVQIFGRSLG